MTTEESPCFVSGLFSVVLVGVVSFIARKFFKGTQFTERVSAKEKVAVVTGASGGIGLETVAGLNKAKAKVYMLCRSLPKAEEAVIDLVKKGCDATRLIIVHCDFNDFNSVRQCAKTVLEVESKIDILVNNAGVACTKYAKSVDGHEETWQTNHLGPFLLTELLLPAVKQAKDGRIVNVSSRLALKSPRIDVNTVDEKSSFGLLTAYPRSKLANIMHARELTRKLRANGSNVIINSLHPGVVNSELGRNTFLSITPIFQITAPFRWFFMKTNRDGAQTTLYVALSKKVDGVSGKYFSNCKLSDEGPIAKNESDCEALYEYSLKQVGLLKSNA
ncbi:unnamed protein product [Auanema sp. JU1783]|nr:unnamed protein product [Auanema sp. JU1783]